jgi:hypothetical protein
MLYKYTRFKLSTFRNPVHCSICCAIKSTEIDDEFLSFISTRELNSQPSGIQSTALPVELSWVLILYKYTRFKLSTFRNPGYCSTCWAIKSIQRLVMSSRRLLLPSTLNLQKSIVHCSNCCMTQAIKSTKIGSELLELSWWILVVSYLNITRKIKLDLPKLTNGEWWVIFEDSVTNWV